MSALANYAKFTGQYDRWLQLRQRYSLKWTSGTDSLASLQRFFNPELSLDHMLQKVKKMMMQVLPEPMAVVIRHALLTRLRCSETFASVRLIQNDKTFKEYYDPDTMTLSHYKFKEHFLRTTKKAYLRYIKPDNLQPIVVQPMWFKS